MRQSSQNTVKLPRQLLDELGSSAGYSDGFRKKSKRGASRKEQRKAVRAERKSNHIPTKKAQVLKNFSRDIQDSKGSFPPIESLQTSVKSNPVQPKPLKSILKVPKVTSAAEHAPTQKQSTSPPPILPPTKKSRALQDRLAADDAEIAALEKALGVRGKKNLPKSFKDDGLDSLLEGIDDSVGLGEEPSVKRKRNEEEQWLKYKRRKAQALVSHPEDSGSGEDRDNGDRSSGSENSSFFEDESEGDEEVGRNEEDEFEVLEEDESDRPLSVQSGRRPRENPYVAPTAGEPRIYVPPSLRSIEQSEPEDLTRLRRQSQGLLNRLSEANMISILTDVEHMYRDRPRQHVSRTLLGLLMDLFSEPTTLQDTFVILHAGFIAAVYKVVGPDFGTQAIQRIHDRFQESYSNDSMEEGRGKQLKNLISLLSELYIFQVISSNLIYDFIRLCLKDFSESNTELLLTLVRTAGPQLRQDDPLALKDIIIQLHASMAIVGEDHLSIRTKFMIETINNLKNNRMKTGAVASTITSEHTIRMKKVLGSLNTRNLKANEPLHIGLADLRNRDKLGTWWLVGASYQGKFREGDSHDDSKEQSQPNHHEETQGKDLENVGVDLIQLAKNQRMNTDVRRSIFIAIMSSSDYNDAYARLMKLRLKRSQELEIPKVLIHCAGAEKIYNPFYTLLSRRVCSDKRLRISFQFSLWDLFKQMGEGDNEPDSDQHDQEEEARLGLRSLVNLAKMFGVLIACDGLSFGILKNLNLAYLQQRTRMFVEVLTVAAILHLQQASDGFRDEKRLLDLFLKPKEMPDMAGGLQYFLKKIVRKTDIAGSKSEMETVKWACKAAGDALMGLATQRVVDE